MGDGNFLLCYIGHYYWLEFGFFIDKTGRRAHFPWIINWVGSPTKFAYNHPFIIAFDQSFVEIRSIENGGLEQIIPVQNLRILSDDPIAPECVADADTQIIFKIVPAANDYRWLLW